jgi:16S rRNA (adenine1518-N6/adenine1519-N6)-dimethyltransferase
MNRSRTPGPPAYAKKSLGQNFLTDPGQIRRIVEALDMRSGERIVEIGPGRGALTAELLAAGASVAAVELDRDLVPFLRGRFSGYGNLRIVEGDALEVDLADLAGDSAKLVANLPYYISTAILRRLAAERTRFSVMVLMLQKEVADRIVALPGDRERGFLTVIVDAFFDAVKLFEVPAQAFSPVPKVTSAVVKLVPKSTTGISDEARFEELLSVGFRQKRKTILNNLKSAPGFGPSAAEALTRNGIDPRLRPEDLRLADWVRLSEIFIS